MTEKLRMIYFMATTVLSWLIPLAAMCAAPTLIDESLLWEYGEAGTNWFHRQIYGCRFDGTETVNDIEYHKFITVYRKSWSQVPDTDNGCFVIVSDIEEDYTPCFRALIREENGVVYRYIDAEMAKLSEDANIYGESEAFDFMEVRLNEGDEIILYDFNQDVDGKPGNHMFDGNGRPWVFTGKLTDIDEVLMDGNSFRRYKGPDMFPSYAERIGVLESGTLDMPLINPYNRASSVIFINNVYDSDGNIFYRGVDNNQKILPLKVDTLSTSTDNSAVEYFSLQGMRIDNPSKGQTVIRRANGRSEKIIIR